MSRSQIKRAPDDFFQLGWFNDFRHRPDALRSYDSLLKQSHIKQAPDGSFFGNTTSTLFRSEIHLAATGRTSDGARSNTCRSSCRRLATLQSPSGQHTILKCYRLRSTIL